MTPHTIDFSNLTHHTPTFASLGAYVILTSTIFLGYPSNHKGFHCLDLQTKKIIISRHVTFDESIFPFGSMTPNSSPNYDFLDVDEHNIFNDPLRPPPPIVPPTELSST